MLPKSINYFLFIFFIVFFVSCQKSEVYPIEEESVIVFKGLRVIKPAGIPSELFELKDGEAVKNYLVKRIYGSSGGRVAIGSVTSDDFKSLLDKIVEKYPNNLGVLPYSNAVYSRIRHDFPDINTEEKAQENAEIIILYYNRLISSELEVELSKLRNKSGSGRVAIDYNNNWKDLNPWEQEEARADPVAGYCVSQAKDNATLWTNQHYGNQADGWRGNAFKHATWNSNGVGKMINSGYSRWSAYTLMKRFALAHERDPDTGVLGVTENYVMDLHNNVLGRSYMRDNITWGLLGLRKMPSESEIQNHWRDYCDNKILIGNREYILGLIYNDLYALAGANYVDYYLPVALHYNP
jgi:hypothetical protein